MRTNRFDLKKKPVNGILCCVMREGMDPYDLPPVCGTSHNGHGGLAEEFSPLPETFSFVYSYTLPELVNKYEGKAYPLLRERWVIQPVSLEVNV